MVATMLNNKAVAAKSLMLLLLLHATNKLVELKDWKTIIQTWMSFPLKAHNVRERVELFSVPARIGKIRCCVVVVVAVVDDDDKWAPIRGARNANTNTG